MPESAEVDKQGADKSPHFINFNLLEALGGLEETYRIGENRTASMIRRGAYLWGVEDREKGKGIFNHILLSSRVAYHIGKELLARKAEDYVNLNLEYVVQATILHDIVKLYGEDREKLPVEIKKALNMSTDFREISDAADEVAVTWLRGYGFPQEIYSTVIDHDFPRQLIDNPYWKIVLLADFMTGQKIMSIDERLADIKKRWIDEQLQKKQDPRIEPERFEIASRIVNSVATEIFGLLGTTDQEFISSRQLNSEVTATRWEKFLRSTRNARREDRAKRLVRVLIG